MSADGNASKRHLALCENNARWRPFCAVSCSVVPVRAKIVSVKGIIMSGR